MRFRFHSLESGSQDHGKRVVPKQDMSNKFQHIRHHKTLKPEPLLGPEPQLKVVVDFSLLLISSHFAPLLKDVGYITSSLKCFAQPSG